jgi:predicted small integral membrane protein
MVEWELEWMSGSWNGLVGAGMDEWELEWMSGSWNG